MTAAYEKDGQIVIQKLAGADLSSSQYHFVKFSSGAVIECAAATDVPVGVLQNAPESGYPADVLIFGVTKVSSNAAIAQDALIGTSSDAQAVTLTIGTDTTAYIAGRALEASSGANALVTAFVNCANPARAA